MELTRRSLLSLPRSTGISAQSQGTSGQRNSSSSEEAGHGVLVDITKCTGCRACVLACKQWNHLMMSTQPDKGKDADEPPGLNSNSFTTVRTIEITEPEVDTVYWKKQCMHCLEPACETACIVGALKRNKETGAVTYNQGKCIGCRYCMVACPFGIPTYQWDERMPWIRKCTFCADRQADNLQPACVGTCPSGALKFGTRGDLVAEAHSRIAAHPRVYHDHVYGEEEAGGTAWMYLSPVPFEDLDFVQLSEEPAPKNARTAMGTLPYYATGMLVLMGSIYFVTKRKQKLTAANKADNRERGG